jgi:putative ABC transport system permease protein
MEWQTLVSEIRHSVKSLRRNPFYTLFLVGTLAVSMAGTLCIFAIVDAVLFRALPYPESERIVIFHWFSPGGKVSNLTSAQLFFFLRQHANSFKPIAASAASTTGANMITADVPQYVKILPVSADYFDTLGIEPSLGRGFLEEEDVPGGDHSVVLSYSLWQNTFSGDRNVLNRQIQIGPQSYRVIGVMPRQFESYPEADVWLPLQLSAGTAGNNFIQLAKRRAEVDDRRSVDELARLSQQFLKEFPSKSGIHGLYLSDERFRDYLVGDSGTGLLAMLASVCFVLLITMANLGTLFMSRMSVYERELAIRAALGAASKRLQRLVLIDSLVLSVLGTVAGVFFAYVLLPIFLSLAPQDLPRAGEIRLGSDVLFLAIGLALFSTVALAMIPLFRIRRMNIQSALRDGTRAKGRLVTSFRTAHILLTAEAAASIVLLLGAILLVGSFLQVRSVPLGFVPESRYVVQVSLANQQLKTAGGVSSFTNDVLSRIQSSTGVVRAAAITGLPFESGLNVPMYPFGHKELNIDDVEYRTVTPDYFQTIGMTLINGRPFIEADNRESAAPIAVVNETLAHKWWPGKSSMGEHIVIAEGLGAVLADKQREVVGVVADVHEAGLDKSPPPTIFVPQAQQPNGYAAITNEAFFLSFVVQSAGSSDISHIVRNAVREVRSQLPIASTRPAVDLVRSSLANFRFHAWLTGAFAGFAVLLTFIGLYGLLSYQISLRKKEIGVRMALGAQRGQVLLSVIRESLLLVGIGAVIGTFGGWLLSRFLTSLLYGITANNPMIYIALILICLFIALAAAWMPAQRAVRIDPIVALKVD